MNTPNMKIITVIPHPPPIITMASVMTPVTPIMDIVIHLRPMRSDKIPNRGAGYNARYCNQRNVNGHGNIPVAQVLLQVEGNDPQQ